MKNFTNNFKQFTSRLSARWLIMALMMLVGTSSAWAEMWINETNGWNIEIERNGTSTWLGGANGFNREDKAGAYKDYSAENTTSLIIKNAWVKASSNDGWQFRYVTLYYRVSTNQTGNFTQLKCKDLGNSITNASSSYFELSNINKSIIDGLSGGTYYLDYYFTVGNDGCDKGYSYAPEYNCNGNTPHPSQSGAQNCSYYSIKFKVPTPEKKYSLGGYIQVGNSMADKSTYYSTYDLAKQTDGTYKGTFSFSTSHNNAQYIYIVDNAGTIYGPQTNDYPMSPGGSTTLSSGKSNKVKASIDLNTEYVFTFNPSTGAFTYSSACETPTAPNVTGTTNVVKCGDNVTTNGTITIDNYVNTSTYKLQLGSNEAQTVTPTNGVFSVSANGTYKLTVTNVCGSSSSTSNISVGLTQNQVTISAISGPENICSGSSENYSITAIDDVTYNWSIDSDKFTLGDNGTNSIQVTATGTADATATLTVTATKSGCPTPQTKSINLIAPITTVTLEHANSDGTLKAETPTYCVGDVVYFKLTHDGSPFSEYDWTTYPGSGLAGYCSNGSGLYHFTLSGSGTIGISLRNEANVDLEGNPTWVESDPLGFNTHPEPTAPYISIDPASGVLCEGNTATITVTNPSTDCAYKLVDESLEAEFVEYESGDLKYSVGSVGKYYVAAKHIDCPTNEYTSNQVEINQIISTSASISIDPANPETTPWEPVTITVKPDAGYIYELSYTDGNLAGVDGVIIKQNGDSYTYYIPRPWGTGDSDSDPVRAAVEYGIKAQLKVDGEASQCNLNYDTATILLKDEDNENCHQQQEP